MSRVGNKPIPVPGGVTVTVAGGGLVTVKGPKGELSYTLPPRVTAEVKDGAVLVARDGDAGRERALHGTARSLIANMIQGVSEGYQKELEIQGVGYRAQLQGTTLVMSLGYSHPIEFDPGPGVTIEVADQTKLKVSGVDKQRVGEVSARIRGFAKAEPYKGKGVRYKDEHVRRKAGKTVA